MPQTGTQRGMLVSTVAGVALSSVFTVIPLTVGTAGSPEQARSKTVSFDGLNQLDHVDAFLDTIAGGAVQIVWYLCRDANGDEGFTDVLTDTFALGAATATDAFASVVIDRAYRPTVDGTVFLAAKLNAGGTANGRFELYWSE